MRPARLFGTGIRNLPSLISIDDTCQGRNSAIFTQENGTLYGRERRLRRTGICRNPNKPFEEEAMLTKNGVLKREFMDWGDR